MPWLILTLSVMGAAAWWFSGRWVHVNGIESPTDDDRRAARLIAAAKAVAAGAVLHGIRWQVMDLPFVVDDTRWSQFSSGLAIFLVIVLATLALRWFAGTDRLWSVFAPVLLWGGLGAYPASLQLVEDVNMAFDRGPVTFYQTYLGAPSLIRARRRGIGVSSELWPWHGEPSGHRLRMSTTGYRELSNGMLAAAEHPGALGLRWVDQVLPLPLCTQAIAGEGSARCHGLIVH